MSYRFLNPYNFVRWLPSSSGDAAGRKDLGRQTPPSHECLRGLCGTITCILENVTPLFIPDAEQVNEDEKGHKTFRFFRLNDKYALPGSSIKGMVRSVFEAVTNSCFYIFEPARLSYHLPAGEARNLWPARVEKDGDQWRLRILTGTARFHPKGCGRNERLPAAWVMRYPYGTLRNSPTVRENASTPYAARQPISAPDNIKHGSKCFALLEPMEHPPRTVRGRQINRFDFWNVMQLSTNRAELEPIRSPQYRIEEGWYFHTNFNIENKHDERFFFPANNSIIVDLPASVRQTYVDLIADYQKRHQKAIEKRHQQGPPPENASDNQTAFSHFIIESQLKLQDGELVYAMLEGKPTQPQVKFIVPVSVPRVGYEHTVGDLLPGHLHPCTEYHALCPACRLFGWVHPDADDAEGDKPIAYAGRMRFSHARLVENKGTLSATLAILSTPKPTTTRFYLLDADQQPISGQSDKRCGYDGKDNKGQLSVLRGRKFYRHHGQISPKEYQRAGNVKNEQNRTVQDALNPGAKFKFQVEFENLSEIELGALLWSFQLEEGWYHRLGGAKPLGFGSVRVAIDNIVLYDARRYLALCGEDDTVPVATEQYQRWIRQFKNALATRYGASSFDDLPHISDFHALLTAAPKQLPIHYPRRTAAPKTEGKNYEWFMENKKDPRFPLPLASDDKNGFPLLNQYGGTPKGQQQRQQRQQGQSSSKKRRQKPRRR